MNPELELCSSRRLRPPLLIAGPTNSQSLEGGKLSLSPRVHLHITWCSHHSFSQPTSWSAQQTPFPLIPSFPWAQQQPRCWNSRPCKDPSPLFCFYLSSCPCPCEAQNQSTQDNEGSRFANNSPPSHSMLAHLLYTQSLLFPTNQNYVLQWHFGGFFLGVCYPDIFAHFRSLLL